MYFFILFLLFPFFTYTMEITHSGAQSRKRLACQEVEHDEDQSAAKVARPDYIGLPDLSWDLHYRILGFLANGTGKDEPERLENSSRDIRSLMLVNRAFADYAYDQQLHKFLYKKFTKYTGTFSVKPIVALKTPASRLYLDQVDSMRKRIFELIDKEDGTEFKKLCHENKHAALSAGKKGFTPLMFAVYENYEKAVDILLSLIKNKKWLQEYIDSRVDRDYLEKKDYINIKAEPNSFSISEIYAGQTALNIAAHRGFLPLMKKLISAGAGLNNKDNDEETPLHAAAANNYVKAVQYLLDSGADKNAVNAMGENALDERLAFVRGNEDDPTVILLRKYGMQSIDD